MSLPTRRRRGRRRTERPPHPRYIEPAALEPISMQLQSAIADADSTAFDKAVCDAFALFGVVAQHIGGTYASDGILDAPLGPLAYRAVLECKSTPHVKFVSQPRPEEVAKFRASSNADLAVVVGEFTSRTDFMQKDSAARDRTVADIITALVNDVDAYECRDLFAPGFVTERLADLVWSRSHGDEKGALVVRP